MNERITVVLQGDNVVKLRALQAKEIKRTMKTVSFSKVINDVVKKGLK